MCKWMARTWWCNQSCKTTAFSIGGGFEIMDSDCWCNEKYYELHANYIINTGGAKIQDIKTLIQKIRKIVKDKDGTILNTEVKIVEEWWREYFYLY